jgi:hypothetical protein
MCMAARHWVPKSKNSAEALYGTKVLVLPGPMPFLAEEVKNMARQGAMQEVIEGDKGERKVVEYGFQMQGFSVPTS